jgi:hypothetical protein
MSFVIPILEHYNETQQKILWYLYSGVSAGQHYFKSKYIASELGLTSKEVGTNLGILADICDDLSITRWSYSHSTTWMVTPRA